MYRIIFLLSLLALSGCKSAALETIKYHEFIKSKTNIPGQIELISGSVTGGNSSYMMPVGGVYVSMATPSSKELHYNTVDQEDFINSLKQEIEKLNIFSLTNNKTKDIMHILVKFKSTEYIPNFQQYKLYVDLDISYKEYKYNKSYTILSSKGDTEWEKWTTSAVLGKAKASQKLKKRVLIDIDNFIGNNLLN